MAFKIILYPRFVFLLAKSERQEKTRFDQNPSEILEVCLLPSTALDLVFSLPFSGFGLMINSRAREL